jgi:hypothetical protein
MSIVPAACLSSSELALLGNNLRAVRKRRSRRRQVQAVNQALAVVREQLGRFQQSGPASSRLGRVT